MSALFSNSKHEEGHVPGNFEAETVIGPSVKVEGTFLGQGNVVVEGEVVGTLKTEKDLMVGEQAKIQADVHAANMMVAGEIHGNIQATGKVDLSPAAKIFGDVTCAVLSIASGAIVQGRCMTGTTTTPPPTPSAEPKTKK